MADPRHTATNAADSAPGVDDGRATRAGAPVDSKPGGRKWVMWAVLISLALLVIVFIARPGGERSAGDGDGALSATREELQVSREPDSATSARTDPSPTNVP